ncbi:hypothetical protein LOAG_11694 [Loa loa]|uniref:Uncharacterized protein n=1 Tax=Loa loa TaxID=7209 RepID=A0A1S0TML3_LOALO|nr:hypothetical protein LOAG_11694 [Loa loa]EFO16809.1 hypothetical protein LOAG_11694 [Loa loa]
MPRIRYPMSDRSQLKCVRRQEVKGGAKFRMRYASPKKIHYTGSKDTFTFVAFVASMDKAFLKSPRSLAMILISVHQYSKTDKQYTNNQISYISTHFQNRYTNINIDIAVPDIDI